MPRDHDNDDDYYPHTLHEIDLDDEDDFMDDDDDLIFDDDDDDDSEEYFDEDGSVNDRGYAVLAEMDRKGLFL